MERGSREIPTQKKIISKTVNGGWCMEEDPLWREPGELKCVEREEGIAGEPLGKGGGGEG